MSPVRSPILIHAIIIAARALWTAIPTKAKRQARRIVEIPPIIWIDVISGHVPSIFIAAAVATAQLLIIEPFNDPAHLVGNVVVAVPVVETDLETVTIGESPLETWATAGFCGIGVGLRE